MFAYELLISVYIYILMQASLLNNNKQIKKQTKASKEQTETNGAETNKTKCIIYKQNKRRKQTNIDKLKGM